MACSATSGQEFVSDGAGDGVELRSGETEECEHGSGERIAAFDAMAAMKTVVMKYTGEFACN